MPSMRSTQTPWTHHAAFSGRLDCTSAQRLGGAAGRGYGLAKVTAHDADGVEGGVGEEGREERGGAVGADGVCRHVEVTEVAVAGEAGRDAHGGAASDAVAGDGQGLQGGVAGERESKRGSGSGVVQGAVGPAGAHAGTSCVCRSVARAMPASGPRKHCGMTANVEAEGSRTKEIPVMHRRSRTAFDQHITRSPTQSSRSQPSLSSSRGGRCEGIPGCDSMRAKTRFARVYISWQLQPPDSDNIDGRR